MIIHYSTDSDFTYKVLANKGMVAIGLISYAVYLWHFPLLAFGLISGFSVDNNMNKFLILAAVFALSIVSYYLVENPIRNRKKVSVRAVSGILLPITVVLVGFQAYVMTNQGLAARSNPFFSQPVPWLVTKNEESKPCHNQVSDLCQFNSTGSKRLLIVGDSNMASINPGLIDHLVENDYAVTIATADWCYFLPDAKYIDRNTKENHRFCEAELRENIKSRIYNEDFDSILIGGRLAFYLTNEPFDNGEGGVEGVRYDMGLLNADGQEITNANIIDQLHKLGQYAKLILLYPTPEVGLDVKSHLFNNTPPSLHDFDEYIKSNPLSTNYDAYKERQKDVFKIYDSINLAGTKRIYPHKLFCSDETNRCKVTDGDKIYFYDAHHLTQQGADLISAQIIENLD